MSTFEDAIRAAGLLPRQVIPDGRIHRCPTQTHERKRNGWFVLREDGSGSYGDWSVGTGEALGHWRDETTEQTGIRVDQAKIDARRATERAYRLKSMQGARDLWARSRRLMGGHPYLTRKGLTMLGCTGLRVTAAGELLIPVMHGNWLVSCQTIDRDGGKRFYTGAPVKAGSFRIDRPRSAVTCIVEGLATGLAVFQSIPQASVVVAFDAGNLMPASQALKLTGSIVVCADNDHGTQAKRGMNPGLEKARNVAELLGCGVAYPKDLEGGQSDWCDVLMSHGDGAHRHIAREILKHARWVG